LADNNWPPDKTRGRGTKNAATGTPTTSPGTHAVNSPDVDHAPELTLMEYRKTVPVGQWRSEDCNATQTVTAQNTLGS